MKFLFLLLTASIFLSCYAPISPVDIVTAPAKSVERISKAASAGGPISEQEEYYIGRAVASNIVAKYPILENSELTQYLNLIGTTIALNSDRPRTLSGYHFAVLDTEDINAYACPGGIIFITRGVIESVNNEDELAAVLAHEVAHISNKDGTSSIESTRGSGLFAALIKEPFKIAGNLGPGQLALLTNMFVKAVDDVFDTVVINGYSPEQELKADRDAVSYLTRSGYDPEALLIYETKLYNDPNFSMERKMNTHPGLEERIRNIKATIPPSQPNQQNFDIRKERFERVVQPEVVSN